MKIFRILFLSYFVIFFAFRLTAQEKNNNSIKNYKTQYISAKHYPGTGLNLSSLETIMDSSYTLPKYSRNNLMKQNPKISFQNLLNPKYLSKQTSANDIPVLNSEKSEKNPALLALMNSTNNSEIILVAEQWESTNKASLIIVKSYDHGLSWKKDSSLVISDSQGSLVNPKLAQISDSSFCVVFQRDWNVSDQDIYAAIIKNDLSASDIVAIDPTPNKNSNPAIICDYFTNKNNSSLYVVYYQIMGTQSKIIFRKSVDGGSTWSYFELATVNTPEKPYCSISSAEDVLYVAFTHKTGASDDIIGFVSTNKGDHWSNFTFLAYSNKHERFPNVVVADTSFIFVMYESWYSETDRDILYAYTENTGSTWQINDVLTTSDDDERFPEIKMMPGTPEIYSGYLNFSRDKVLVTNTIYLLPSFWADPWSLNKDISILNTLSFMALLPKLSPEGKSGISAAWCQNGNNEDIYFSASWTTDLITISGFVKTDQGNGINQVVIQGLPNSPITDDYGFYTDQVVRGWSGTTTPQKAGWDFLPSSMEYNNITTDRLDQNYIGSKKTFTISGFIKDKTGKSIKNVTLQGLPSLPVTDSLGFYSDILEYHWSGTVTPVKTGWGFLPTSRVYENLENDQSDQSYQGKNLKLIISGFIKDSANIPVADVILTGLPNITRTNSTGFYADSVVYNWTGNVTPEKIGWEFSPALRIYKNVVSNQIDQFYSANLIQVEISGVVSDSSNKPIQGVKLDGLPKNPVTVLNGFYSDSVSYGWSGLVTPIKQGLLFSPQNRIYNPIIDDQKEQNYIGSIIQYVISGNVFDSNNLPNKDVVLTGLPGNPKTDVQGFYSAVVPSGWNGTVTPMKEGWEFIPPFKNYKSIGTDRTNQNYSSSLKKIIISGRVSSVDHNPLADILMEGLPKTPLTDLTGFYSDTVFWGWSGTIAPKSHTWHFSPTKRILTNVTENKLNQDFWGSTVQLTISGFIKDSLQNPVSEVLLTGFLGETKTDSSGFYSGLIPVNWSGSISPQKEGWRFIPASKIYTNVQVSIDNENYTGVLKKLSISGIILDQNQEPVVYVLINGLPNSPITDLNGFYSDSVFYDWSGTIVPQKEGFYFSPFSKTFHQVRQHKTGQNFVGAKVQLIIAGFVWDSDHNPVPKVVLQGLPNNPISDLTGFYSDTLFYDWSGVVTPYKDGWEFSPASKIYTNVLAGLSGENYIGNVISAIQEKDQVPETYFLSQNYPNPFSIGRNNPTTIIEFGMPETAHVSLKIYDLNGREVSKLVDETLRAGVHKTEWTSQNLPSGTYFLLFISENFSQAKKIILLR